MVILGLFGVVYSFFVVILVLFGVVCSFFVVILVLFCVVQHPAPELMSIFSGISRAFPFSATSGPRTSLCDVQEM